MSCTYGSSVAPGIDPDSEIMLDRAKWEEMSGTPSTWFDPFLAAIIPTVVKVSDLCAANVEDPPLPDLAILLAGWRGLPIALSEIVTYMIDKMEAYEASLVCVCNAASGDCAFSNNPAHIIGFSITESFVEYARWATVAGSVLRTDVNNRGSVRLYYKLLLYHGGTLADAITTGTAVEAGAESQINWGTSAGGHPWTYWSDISIEIGGNVGFTGPVDIDIVQEWTAPCIDTPVPTPEPPVQPPEIVLPPAWECGDTSDICQRLQQIDQKLQWVYDLVTLIQRQAVPFGYVLSSSHSVSGSGHFSVQGILGLSVDITATPAQMDVAYGDPDTYFEFGWLALGTDDGSERSYPIRHDKDLLLDVSPAATRVGYTLRPGVSATITELIREP